jgi:uncharacterized protein (TIGR03437 family)
MSFGRVALAAILAGANAIDLIAGCASAPQMSFATYLGGSQFEHVRDVVTDAAGNIYAVGGTESADFRTTVQFVNGGAKESNAVQSFDAFVVKLSPQGAVLWSARIGGPNYDRAYGIELDPQGNLVIAGRAGRGFPVTPGAFQTAFQGGSEAPFYGNEDGFILKMTNDGQRIIWASYFGTSDPRAIRDVAVDKSGNIYLASNRTSGAYVPEVARAFLNQPIGGTDGVLAKIAGDGSRVIWARYIGGTGDEGTGESSVRVDANDNVLYLTQTQSVNAPTTSGALQRSFNGVNDMYVTKWTSDGVMIYGTYLGGSLGEGYETHNLAVDALGNAYVAASTHSSNFPTTPGAFDRTFNGSGAGSLGVGIGDGFVTKISPTGSLVASTYIGGRNGDMVEGIAVDSRGIVHITGRTYSDNFPVTDHAYQRTKAGQSNAFYAEFSSDLRTLLYSTFYGGSGVDFGRALAVDDNGNAVFGGEAGSRNFPVMNAAQSTFIGPTDAFVARVTTNTGGFCLSTVLNLANNTPGLVPGGLIAIVGSGLTQGINGTVDGGGATSVQGTSVFIGGVAAPILSLTSAGGVDQINAQTPFEAASQTSVAVSVNNNGQVVEIGEELVLASQPGIFDVTGSDGVKGPAIVHLDGTLVTPANPAQRGEELSVYFTGGGPLSPEVGTGVLGPAPPAAMTLPVVVTLGGAQAEILFAGYTPGALGLYQVNFRAPDTAQVGSAVTLTLRVGEAETGVTVGVR